MRTRREMSRRRAITLIALVWLVAAGLMVLPNLWPWYLHRLPYIDQPLWFAAGWGWSATWKRHRAKAAA